MRGQWNRPAGLIRGLNGLGGFPIVHLSVLRRYLVPHGILIPPSTPGGGSRRTAAIRSHTGPRQRPRDHRVTARARRTREQVEREPPLLPIDDWEGPAMGAAVARIAHAVAASGQRDLRPCRQGHAD